MSAGREEEKKVIKTLGSLARRPDALRSRADAKWSA